MILRNQAWRIAILSCLSFTKTEEDSMRIRATDSHELNKHDYKEIMPGVYACPDARRLLIIQPEPGDHALLIEVRLPHNPSEHT